MRTHVSHEQQDLAWMIMGLLAFLLGTSVLIGARLLHG